MPRLHPAAWHGPIGAAVVKVAPVTEADPAAVLASALAVFGAAAGDAAWVRVGGVRHPARVWPLIVGKTGSGRKGTSMAVARRLTRTWGEYAAQYEAHRLITGLASGEGLIYNLGGSAPEPEEEVNGKPKRRPERQSPRAPDGRLTVVETEFARVLAAAKRDGSTLGPILRQLWDDGDAASLTRTDPVDVRGAHLGMVAHVTPRELKLRLAESDLAGGTLNRFLLVASERPQLLAHEAHYPDIADEAEQLAKALDQARMHGHEMTRDRRADKLWTEVYAALNAEEPDGHLGSVLARGPAYTMRLALAYALADRAGAIGPKHLLAALAVWQYSVASARMVFPEGRSGADMHRLAGYLIAADEAGRTRTECSRLFGVNKTAAQLAAMLDEFEAHAQITVTKEGRDGAGRPTMRYRWTGKPIDPMLDLLTRHFERT
jgi:hypothetical protein